MTARTPAELAALLAETNAHLDRLTGVDLTAARAACDAAYAAKGRAARDVAEAVATLKAARQAFSETSRALARAEAALAEAERLSHS
jgi:hypothetical protein